FRGVEDETSKCWPCRKLARGDARPTGFWIWDFRLGIFDYARTWHACGAEWDRQTWISGHRLSTRCGRKRGVEQWRVDSGQWAILESSTKRKEKRGRRGQGYVVSVVLPDAKLSGAGSRSSRIAIPSALPCVSSRSDRLAPPARAFSITKLNARKWGTSYCRTLPISSGSRYAATADSVR